MSSSISGPPDQGTQQHMHHSGGGSGGVSNRYEEPYDDREDVDVDVDVDSFSTPYHNLSCHQCRNRKVKCDRNSPCTQCVLKSLECTYPTGLKVRKKRQRVLVSTNYENKIDDMSRKLDKLCHIVETTGSVAAESTQGQATPTSTLSFITPSPAPSVAETADVPRPDLNDEPTLAAQAAFATDYAQRVFHHSIISHEMTRSLEKLSKMLKGDDSTPPPPPSQAFTPSHSADLGQMQLPPMELTMSCIQKLRTSKSLMFYWTWDIDTAGQLLEYITTVYTAQPSTAELVIVYSTLSRLFYECVREEPHPSPQAELRAQAKQCEENLALIISRLPFNLATTFDNILALYYITLYMMGQCKPLAAWRYISASVQMCQTLGYNRERALVPESPQQRRRRKRLVWMIIIIDKTLSLRLGRASSIRNGEFTLEKLSDNSQDDLSAFSFMTLLSKWIELSLLEGQVYDDIFSPTALLQPENVRESRARALAADIQRVFETMGTAETQVLELRRQSIGNEMHELSKRADRISHLATLTLVYRAIPTGPYSNSVFCDECVATACQALNEHRKCLDILKKVGDEVLEMYLQWAILLSPFIPYIVLFCRTLETSDPAYLDSLATVVEILNLLPANLPKPYRVQLKVFQAMYEVACDYVNANRQGGRSISQRLAEAVPEVRDISSMVQPGSPFGAMLNLQGVGSGTIDIMGEAYLHNSSRTNSQQASMVDSGLELGMWMDHNQRVFTMLEDIY